MASQRVNEEAKRRMANGEHPTSHIPHPTSRFTPHASVRSLPLGRLTWLYLLGGIVLLYAALSLYQVNLPGLHYDEAFEAVPALQLWQRQPVTAFRNSGLTLGGQTFPLMTQDYIGAINTYAAIPFIAMLGPAPAALRVMSILLGAITLGLTYLLTGQLSGSRRAGLMAALLLAVDPTFIFWNRQGIFVTAVTAAIGLAATLCWLRRWQGGSAVWTLAGAFLFGLGIYAKLLFVWLIIALIGAVVLINLPDLIRRSTSQPRFSNPEGIINSAKFGPAEILGALLAFLAGCWPLLVYNIQTGGTFLSLSQNAATSYYGVNNLALGPNLLERLKQFTILLNGSHLWYLGQAVSNPIPVLIFGALALVILIKAAWQPTFTSEHQLNHFTPLQKVLFPFLVIALVTLASIGTVSALWITHFAILMPWPAIAVAVGVWFVGRGPEASNKVAGSNKYHALRTSAQPPLGTHHASVRSLSLGRLMVTIGLSLLIVTNFINVIRYHLALTESGGLSGHSDAIYDLSAWLAGHAT
ncbi:MAG TPA: glycosyltransferase family 39 protein, partial [Anaerolineae bacterium]|nr:glycosyltransferase family 39 protein [Anaerolineae bacterium]